LVLGTIQNRGEDSLAPLDCTHKSRATQKLVFRGIPFSSQASDFQNNGNSPKKTSYNKQKSCKGKKEENFGNLLHRRGLNKLKV
jgi:hypothetical protein